MVGCFLFAVLALPCFECNVDMPSVDRAAKQRDISSHSRRSHRHAASDRRINHTAGTGRACWWLMPNLERANHGRRTASRSQKSPWGLFRSHEQMPRGELPHPWPPGAENPRDFRDRR
jgi:hypothetical protein